MQMPLEAEVVVVEAAAEGFLMPLPVVEAEGEAEVEREDAVGSSMLLPAVEGVEEAEAAGATKEAEVRANVYLLSYAGQYVPDHSSFSISGGLMAAIAAGRTKGRGGGGGDGGRGECARKLRHF